MRHPSDHGTGTLSSVLWWPCYPIFVFYWVRLLDCGPGVRCKAPGRGDVDLRDTRRSQVWALVGQTDWFAAPGLFLTSVGGGGWVLAGIWGGSWGY